MSMICWIPNVIKEMFIKEIRVNPSLNCQFRLIEKQLDLGFQNQQTGPDRYYK